MNSGISPRAGLGVEALAVAALALLQRGGDVDEEERAAGLLDHRADLLAGLVERRDRAADRDAAVPGDLGGDPADPADVGLAVLLGEGQPGRQVPAYDVAVEAGDRALAAARAGGPCSARASVDLPLPDRPVKKSTRPCSSGAGGRRRRSRRSSSGQVAARRSTSAEDVVGAGVGRDDLHAEGVVGLGVAVGGERHGDDGGVAEQVGGRAGWRGAAPTGERRGCRCRSARAAATGRPARGQLRRARPSVSGVDDRDERARRRTARAPAAGVRWSRRNGPNWACVERRRRAPSGARPGPAAGPRGRPARRSLRPRASSARQVRVTGLPGSLKPVSGASAPLVSSSRSSSSRGRRAVLGRGTGRMVSDTRGRSCSCGADSLRAMSAPVVVAEIVRSGFVEGHHYGSVVALDRRRRASTGRSATSTTPVLPRSCNKPIQALGHGAGRPRPAAATCWRWPAPRTPASPSTSTAYAGSSPPPASTRPRCRRPPDYPLDDDGPRGASIRAGGAQAPVLMNCSGKHAAMLATCVRQRLGHRDLPRRPTTRSSGRSPRPSPSSPASRSSTSPSTAAARRCCPPR